MRSLTGETGSCAASVGKTTEQRLVFSVSQQLRWLDV